jgi:hypothetical protein
VLIIENLVRLTILIPVILYLYNKNKELRVIFLFNLFFFFHDLCYSLLAMYSKSISHVFNLFYIPLEFLFIFIFFRGLFQRQSFRFALNLMLAFFLITWLISSFYNPIDSFNSFLNGLESLIVISLTLMYFYEQIKIPQVIFIYSEPTFLSAIAFFLFFAGSFFVFLYKQSHRNEEVFMSQYRYIHVGFFLLRTLFFSLALIVKPIKNPIANMNS